MQTSAIKILPLALLLGGCSTMSIGNWLQPHTVVIDSYCQNGGIIRPSRKDTADTLRQVATSNAKYRSACGQGTK